MRYFRLLQILCLGIILSACASNATPGATPTARFVTTPVPGGKPQFLEPSSPPADGSYPGPAVITPTADSAYPGPTSVSVPSSPDGRGQSALASYKLAEEVALKEYDPAAKFYGIAPSNVMIGNLGGPPVLPGWFFKFKIEGSPREFIVQVVDSKITGTTQAEPVAIVTPVEMPIALADIKLDSPQVWDQFTKYAQEQGIQVEGVKYDFELINLQGGNGPVWSIINSDAKTWIYSISASTGDKVPNPHQGS